MPIGMSRPGRSHSSAHVETASKPMYAKKMTAAPAPMPAPPFGAKGCQFSGRTRPAQTATKSSSTPIFTATMTAFRRADSRTPHTRTAVSTATMAAASALKTMGTPSTCGAPATTPGKARALR